MTVDNKNTTETLTTEQMALRYAELSNTVTPDCFGFTLEGRFLPKWLKESGVGGRFTYEDAVGTLDAKVIHKSMANMTIDQMNSVVGRAKPALTELQEMKVKWDERGKQSNGGGPTISDGPTGPGDSVSNGSPVAADSTARGAKTSKRQKATVKAKAGDGRGDGQEGSRDAQKDEVSA